MHAKKSLLFESVECLKNQEMKNYFKKSFFQNIFEIIHSNCIENLLKKKTILKIFYFYLNLFKFFFQLWVNLIK